MNDEREGFCVVGSEVAFQKKRFENTSQNEEGQPSVRATAALRCHTTYLGPTGTRSIL
jgi:hypothetical protein